MNVKLWIGHCVDCGAEVRGYNVLRPTGPVRCLACKCGLGKKKRGNNDQH